MLQNLLDSEQDLRSIFTEMLIFSLKSLYFDNNLSKKDNMTRSSVTNSTLSLNKT